jgi:2-polyprenyl-6-methoxyphenol hydroxylase-like FAD-dependent oxidoreductase
MTRSVRRVVVVGGGVGGLALATALDADRFEVVVVEAEPHREATGAALGLWPSARRALDRIGASAGLDGLPVRSAAAALHDLSGRRLVALRGPNVTLVRRAHLLAALSAAVPRTVRRLTEQVTRPESLDGDVVVGADGVRSVVRGLVWPPGAERTRTPYVAMRGIVEDPGKPAAYGEYWGPGALFGIVPLGDGSVYWFSTHRSTLGPEPLDLEVVRAELREALGRAPDTIQLVLDDAGPDTLANRLWVCPPLPRYAHGRYVVIGDAAHASLPNLGRGACDAILDGVSLGEALNAGSSLASWQARRLPATQAARVGAGGLMRLALARRGQAARDRVLQRVGGRRG